MSLDVTLTAQELSIAAYVGARRSCSAKARGRAPAHGFDNGVDGWAMDIEGAAAEMVVAKALGRYWPMVFGRLDLEGDVGENVHVRSTTHPTGRLILHKTDPDEGVFYFVRGKAPRLEVVGFIAAARGKDESYWTDPGTGRPAYFIPDDKLIPMKGRS